MKHNKYNILALYPHEAGGEWIATKQFISSYKKQYGSNTITDAEIRTYKTFARPGPKFQLWLNLISNLSSCWNALSQKFSIKTQREVIYSPSLVCLFVATLHPTSRRSKRIFHFHGMKHDTVLVECKKHRHAFFLMVYIFMYFSTMTIIERITLRKVDKVVCPTETAKRKLRRHFSFLKVKRIEVIPYGIQQNVFNSKGQKKNTSRKTILYSGRLSEDKGVSTIIETAKNLKAFQFLFAYVESSDQLYEKGILFKINYLNNCKAFKNQTPEKLATLYHQSLITILPSRTEVLPLSYLESIACGTPMLTTQVGELAKLQKKIDPRLILEDASTTELQKRIMFYDGLTNKEKIQIQKKCIQLAKQFSWEVSTEKLHNIFIT